MKTKCFGSTIANARLKACPHLATKVAENGDKKYPFLATNVAICCRKRRLFVSVFSNICCRFWRQTATFVAGNGYYLSPFSATFVASVDRPLGLHRTTIFSYCSKLGFFTHTTHRITRPHVRFVN